MISFLPNPFSQTLIAISAISFLVINSCSPMIGTYSDYTPSISTQQTVIEPESLNPHPVGTYDHFKYKDYPAKRTSYRNHEVLSNTNSSNSSITISLSKQRAYLMRGDSLAMDYPISSGKGGHTTPTGTFHIKEKLVSKRSNLYGRIFNSAGSVVNSDATAGVSKIPRGGKFVGASMPYWMRLTSSGIGHHIGRVPRYPASHGCIRGQSATIPTVFSKVRVGTKVRVVY